MSAGREISTDRQTAADVTKPTSQILSPTYYKHN